MRFGAWIPSYAYPGLDYARARKGTDTFAKLANEHDIDLWVIDHLLHAPGLYGMPWLEPMTVLTHAAAVAPDVKMVGTGILVLPLRDPVVLAKEVATMDYLTGGRYQFGIGPGWYGPEFVATGSHISERGQRTDELLEAVRLLLTTPNATFAGKFYSFSDVTIEPRPPKMPNVWVAGGSRIPDGAFDNDVPVLAKSVLERIVGADWWLSRCSGTQEWVRRTGRRFRTGRLNAASPLPGSGTATSPISSTPTIPSRRARSSTSTSNRRWAPTAATPTSSRATSSARSMKSLRDFATFKTQAVSTSCSARRATILPSSICSTT